MYVFLKSWTNLFVYVNKLNCKFPFQNQFSFFLFLLLSIAFLIQVIIQILNSSSAKRTKFATQNSMFNSLKLKLQSLIKNPFQRRSVSICIQSKVKKIDSKRDKSETKYNCVVPQQIQFTPKKIAPHQNCSSSILEQDHQYGPTYDQMQTVSKDTIPFQSNTTRILENRFTNQQWLDFVSDVDSSEKLLLPTPSELGSEVNKINSKKSIQVQEAKQAQQIEKPSTASQKKRNENQIIQGYKTPEKKENLKCIIQEHQKIESKIKIDQKSENTLINWLQENKPDYFMIKINKNTAQKQDLATQLKKNNLRDYRKARKQQTKGPKLHNQCIVCEQKINTNNSKDFISLACTHKIHKICADIIKWKPKMRCNVCERKSVHHLVIPGIMAQQVRRSIGKKIPKMLPGNEGRQKANK